MKIFCETCDQEMPFNEVHLIDGELTCLNCQERAYDRHQERLMEGGGGPSLLEQQRAAYNIKHGIRS